MSHFPQMKATTQTSVKRINLNFKSTSKTLAEVQDEDEDDRQARIFVEAHERNHDPKMVTKRKVKVVKRTNKIVKKARNGKIKRLEDYLNMGNREKRQSIANKITERAKHFKALGDKLASICDIDMSIPGLMSQLHTATTRLENNLNVEDLLSEAVEAARSLLHLEVAKSEFEAEGIPLIVSHELTRRVLDSQILASQELVVHENDDEEEDATEDEDVNQDKI